MYDAVAASTVSAGSFDIMPQAIAIGDEPPQRSIIVEWLKRIDSAAPWGRIGNTALASFDTFDADKG